MAKKHRWFSPDTYNTNYRAVPPTAGVYVILVINLYTREREAVYVGSSTNLRNRYQTHDTLRKIKAIYHTGFHVEFMFREMPQGWYAHEKALIKRLRPKYNTHHKDSLLKVHLKNTSYE